jgi:hypothetical protein
MTRALSIAERAQRRADSVWVAEKTSLVRENEEQHSQLADVVHKLEHTLGKRARDKAQLKQLTHGYRSLQEKHTEQKRCVEALRAAAKAAREKRDVEQVAVDTMRIQLGAVTDRLKESAAREADLESQRARMAAELANVRAHSTTSIDDQRVSLEAQEETIGELESQLAEEAEAAAALKAETVDLKLLRLSDSREHESSSVAVERALAAAREQEDSIVAQLQLKMTQLSQSMVEAENYRSKWEMSSASFDVLRKEHEVALAELDSMHEGVVGRTTGVVSAALSETLARVDDDDGGDGDIGDVDNSAPRDVRDDDAGDAAEEDAVSSPRARASATDLSPQVVAPRVRAESVTPEERRRAVRERVVAGMAPSEYEALLDALMPDAMARAASLTSSGDASAATAATAGEATSAPTRWLGRLFKRRAVSEEGARAHPFFISFVCSFFIFVAHIIFFCLLYSFVYDSVSEEGGQSAPGPSASAGGGAAPSSVEMMAGTPPAPLSAQASFVEQQDEIRSWAAAMGDEYAAEEHAMAAAAAVDAGGSGGGAEEAGDEYPLHLQFPKKDRFFLWLQAQQQRKLASLARQRTRPALIEYYQKHNPGHVDSVDDVLVRHGESEESIAALWAQLKAKYGE